MKDIIISEFMEQSAVDKLSAEYLVHYDPQLFDNSDLTTLLANAKAIIVRNRTQVNVELLKAAAKLKVVGRLGVGLENIDLVSCAAKNITVISATGANDNSVAEYVLATAMIMLRSAYLISDNVIQGSWPRENCMGSEITGKVIGLVGLGSISREVAQKAKPLGMEVIAYDPYVENNDPIWSDINRKKNLNALLKEANIVSLHVPLNDATKNLISADAIYSMRKDAVLINTSRGGIIDEKSLVKALKNKIIAGAVLDVFDDEPLDKNKAQIFKGVPNILLTPHIAGVTKESNIRVSSLIAKKVSEFLEGRS